MFITTYDRPTTVAGLPSGAALLEGMSAVVTDATSTVAGGVVSGGGSNIVTVFYNGTNWLVGNGVVAPSGANPTGTAGPSAVNGSASTFMRSDAAPAVQSGSASQQGIVQVDGSTITASAGVISASLGVPKATGTNFTVQTGYQLGVETRLTLTSTQEATLAGNANLILTDDTTPVLVGSPKSNISFTLPTDRFLEVRGELVLNGSQRATLQGNSNLVLDDDFGIRSRIVLH